MMERTELEVLEYLNEKEVKAAQRRMKSFLKNNKLTNKDQVTATIADYSVFHENVRLGVDEKGNILLGQDRLYVSDGERDTPIERITGNADNGYKQTHEEKMMRAIMLNTLIRKQESLSESNHEYGLSYSGWSKFFDFPKIEETESFELQASDYLEECYNLAGNEFFKPTEIVNEFQRAFAVTTKSTISNAFEKIPEIKTEIFYMAGFPDKKNKSNVSFNVISTENFKGMRELRKQILEANGSNVEEYFGHIKKKKDERMKKIYKAVEDGLEFEYGATRFHESVKVELVNPESLSHSIYFDTIHAYFFKHFVERSITYRQGSKNYKRSSYFWRRFYYLNVCYLLQFLDEFKAIDSELYEKERSSFESNFASYLYDFDTGYYLPKEILNEPFFGDMEKEIERRHYERLEEIQNVIKLKECVDDESAYEVYVNDMDARQKELIARLISEPLSETAAYVNDELGDFFEMKPVSVPMQIESVVRATNSKSNSNEKLTTLIVPQQALMSSRKVEIIDSAWRTAQLQKEVDELNESLMMA